MRILLQIAAQNLAAHRWKTLIVSITLALGAAWVVVSVSLLDSSVDAMRQSIISSLAGHIQVYSADSKGEVDVVAGLDSNLTPLEDFERIRALLLSNSNVAAVVPMGFEMGLMNTGNALDLALERLRRAADSPGNTSDFAAQKAHVRQMLSVLRQDAERTQALDEPTRTERLAGLTQLDAESFWTGFDADPHAHVQLLENQLAKLASDGKTRPLRYVGTDPSVFQKVFERMELVDGTSIPPGQRGLLLSKLVYEDQLKLKSARGLDKLKAALELRRASIATDPALERVVRENQTGIKEILLQLDAVKLERFRHKLQACLHSQERDVAALLLEYFATTDANLMERHQFFYAELAPELELYRVRIGEPLTLQALGRNGYVHSANLKVYGTFRFKGLESSPLVGSISMMDLVSMRELHGLAARGQAQELAALQAQAGVQPVSRADAESTLFAARQSDHEPTAHSPKDLTSELRGLRAHLERAASAPYDAKQLTQGSVLSVAVFLRDETKVEDTARAIEHAGRQAGMALRAAPWQSAAGALWQFTSLMRAALWGAFLVTFGVAIVVIGNALVMATLERVRELGTLRAVGAQRRFVLGMITLESLIQGLAAGLLGTVLGAGLLLMLRRTGIPAGNDAMEFLFGGPRLFPSVRVTELAAGMAAVVGVCLASALYPAWLATRVSPREAMQAEE